MFRCRSSRGEHMDSVGLQTHVMDLHSRNRHRSPLPPPANGAAHLSNGNGTIEQWPKLADQSNGREVRKILLHFFFVFFYEQN